jgi:hypothetical protein
MWEMSHVVQSGHIRAFCAYTKRKFSVYIYIYIYHKEDKRNGSMNYSRFFFESGLLSYKFSK